MPLAPKKYQTPAARQAAKPLYAQRTTLKQGAQTLAKALKTASPFSLGKPKKK